VPLEPSQKGINVTHMLDKKVPLILQPMQLEENNKATLKKRDGSDLNLKKSGFDERANKDK
jgi:hypothetical protein